MTLFALCWYPEPLGFSKAQPPFHDPAIMSASFAPTLQSSMNNIAACGPPPGLAFPPGLNSNNNNSSTLIVNSHVSPIPTLDEGSAHGESDSVSPGEGGKCAKSCALSMRERRDQRQCVN